MVCSAETGIRDRSAGRRSEFFEHHEAAKCTNTTRARWGGRNGTRNSNRDNDSTNKGLPASARTGLVERSHKLATLIADPCILAGLSSDDEVRVHEERSNDERRDHRERASRPSATEKESYKKDKGGSTADKPDVLGEQCHTGAGRATVLRCSADVEDMVASTRRRNRQGQRSGQLCRRLHERAVRRRPPGQRGLVAGLEHFLPSLGRYGGLPLPRSHRALKG